MVYIFVTEVEIEFTKIMHEQQCYRFKKKRKRKEKHLKHPLWRGWEKKEKPIKTKGFLDTNQGSVEVELGN